jgi:acetyl-CoA synthetase
MKPEINTLADYYKAYARSIEQPEAFWSEVAHTYKWDKLFHSVLSGDFHHVNFKWFEGGRLNLSENCLDRHLPRLKDKTAILWESNDPKEATRALTFGQLHQEVCRFANVLTGLGVKKGDRVCLYMPMVPEAAIAMLAIVRIGAIHSIVFGGFSASSLSSRINDCGCSVLITADGVMRGPKEIKLKDICDEALAETPSIQKVVVLKRTGNTIRMQPGRDLWWHELMATTQPEHTAVPMDAEDPLFILYTSGSTGKPKGVVHTTGGYMVYVGYTFRNVFQIKPDDVFWCTADVGWITGHSYLVYGPLLNGVTTLMFEGVPNYPDWGRFWHVVDKHKVNILYTAPTAIRSLLAEGTSWLDDKNLASLRVLGSVGEPINEEAWQWYFDNIGKSKCPIVDTWWQTETGGILISPVAGITPSIPSFATLPMPGVQPILLDDKGNEIHYIPGDTHAEGNLCIRYPWPSLARTTWGDHDRFISTYFKAYPGYYFTGDGARRDKDGNYRITGRVDDVINVSGHRIGTAEVENAINEHAHVAESAVVGYPHDIKGQGIYAFVICDSTAGDETMKQIKATVSDKIGPFARPDVIQFVRGLPKTRSGKIMRRILRKIAEGDTSNLGDTSTLLDPTVVDTIKNDAAAIRAAM